MTLSTFVDFSQPSFWFSALAIVFNPTFWNIVARNEYKRKTISGTFNSEYVGCYGLAFVIFGLGLWRDGLFYKALLDQPEDPVLAAMPYREEIALGLFGIGNLLVLTSTWALEITGTYLGDYFGILMEEKVTGFPFTVSSSPMYTGSTLSFLATALWYSKPAGLVLTTVVWFAYKIALQYEDPFTAEIYAARDREVEESKKSR